MMINVLHLRCSGALLGAETVVLELSSRLSEQQGYHAIIGIIQDNRDPYPEIATQANDRQIPCKVFKTNKKFDLQCISEIRRFVIDNKIDLIHTHGYREDIYALFAAKSSIKVATNHLWKKSNFTLKLYAVIDSFCMIFFNHIIAVSLPILSEMKSIPYLKNGKLSLIPNGIDTVRYSPNNSSTLREELNLKPNVFLMTTISSLTIEKGHTFLLDALQKLKLTNKIFHLVIIGEGPKRKAIEEQIIKNNLSDNVSLLGRRYDIDKIHTDTDIYILPSLKEGLPMSLLEAMACGTCCIASDVGDIASCVTHNKTGLLIQPGNTNALFNALILLTSNRPLIKEIGNNAVNIIRKQFSNEIMIQRHSQLYHHILKD